MRSRVIGLQHIDFELLKSWIHTWEKDHNGSCHQSETLFKHDPRFINCHTRKIAESPPTGGYVALSYVWGDVDTTDDILTGSVLRKNLLRTIENAITATKELGYTYLWIDQYCIPQNQNEIKMQQIQQMDSIYQQAAVVIIALGGDPTYGLPGVGGEVRRIPQPYVSKGGHTLASTMRHPKELISASRWATRGWTYQEVCWLGIAWYSPKSKSTLNAWA
jgi:hypothetical protein